MICCNCKLDKHTSEFEKFTDNFGRTQTHHICEECYKNKTAPLWMRNAYKRGELDINFNKGRKTLNYKKYGLTIEQYDELYKSQKGCCAICKKHQSELNKVLCIDHDHKTGKVRGLICNNHNTAIGLLQDDYKMILKTAIYLHKTQGKGEDILETLSKLKFEEYLFKNDKK